MTTHEGGRDAGATKTVTTTNSSAGAPSDRRAGVSPAVSGASRPRFGEVKIRDRGRLPHWEKESATYFVTFRLDDSLPKSVLERIGSERASLVKTARHLKGELTTGERTKLKQLSTKVIEQYLDNGAGACHVKHAAIASVVAEALRHFDNRRYLLFAWCVIPNHVHMVLRILPAHALAEVVHSWKSFLRRRMSSLNLSGGFW